VYAQPNQLSFTLVAAPLGVSNCFTLPTTDDAVLVQATQITLGWRGTAAVNATYAAAEGFPVLTWTGVHAENGSGPNDAVVAGGWTSDGPTVKVVDVGFVS